MKLLSIILLIICALAQIGGSDAFGRKPGPPRNVTVKDNKDGTVLISWLPPEDTKVPVAFYHIVDENGRSWTMINEQQIIDTTTYTTKKLKPGKKYTFVVIAHTLTMFGVSDNVEFVAPMQDKDKANTSALVGKPGPPRNLTVKDNKDGTVLISWLPPEDTKVPVAYYHIEYNNVGSWKKLNAQQIVDTTTYTAKKLNPGEKYTLRVMAKTLTSFQASSYVEFVAPMQDKDKAITAALVGGFLFFAVVIILTVCTVKICNKRQTKKTRESFYSSAKKEEQHLVAEIDDN